MESVAITDVGERREVNQDFVYCNDNSVGILPNLYIVADGMGGHKAGDFASRFCVGEFEKEIKNMTGRTIIGSIESAIRHTNEELLKVAVTNPDYEGMGTTFVAATVTERAVFIANIGDSRMYLLSKNGNLLQITEDHSLVEEMIRDGKLDPKEAKHHPKKNVITRALGAAEHVVPDFFEIEAEEGDYLLICSDGLTNMVEDEVIRSIILQSEQTLAERAKSLIDAANEPGGKDNISVRLIKR